MMEDGLAWLYIFLVHCTHVYFIMERRDPCVAREEDALFFCIVQIHIAMDRMIFDR